MTNLAEVLPSIASGLGVRGFSNRLECPPVQHAVVCLIDGLGARLLDANASDAPSLMSGRRTEIETVFPTTTPAALASLGTGLLPGAHGLVGASFLLPETGEVLSPLSWGDDPSPLAVQPEPTMFERLTSHGIDVSTISAGAYERSGLTRAVLRGASYRPAEGIQDRFSAFIEATSGAQRTLTYVYWPMVDRIGHEYGAGSAQWRSALREADRLIEGLADRMPADSAMLVTADHGMVNCPPDMRIAFDDHADLRADVEIIAGEPRARHLYVRSGSTVDVVRRWHDHLGDRARVLTREELIESALLGDVDEFAAERIGDVVIVSRGETSIASATDPLVSSLLGQHGALTQDELAIPAVWFSS